MLVVLRFDIPEDGVETFLDRAVTALRALAARPGYQAGRAVRATDEPATWLLVLEWETVGAYRRALGAYDVKLSATPLLAQALPGPSAYEVLADDEGLLETDLAEDDGTAGPGRGR